LSIERGSLGTLVLRTITIPVAVINQRNAAKMQIHMPKLQELQGRLQEARIRNDQMASKFFVDNCAAFWFFWLILVMRAGNDMMEFMKYADMKPWKAMLGPFMQVIIVNVTCFESTINDDARCHSSSRFSWAFEASQIILLRVWWTVAFCGSMI
jgi:hypothetical protein